MNNGILYYPTIEFKDEDYNWLVRSSLLWDKIYRIVPEGYNPKDNKKIQALCSSGEIGIPYLLGIRADRARINASLKFKRALDVNFKALEKEFKDDKETLVSLNIAKGEAFLIDCLSKYGLISQNSDGWVFMRKRLADIYMTYLAQEIAQRENLAIATPNSQAWIAASKNNLNYDPLYDSLILRPKNDAQEIVFMDKAACFPLYIKDIIPENFDISPDKILKFREKRKDERKNFIISYENFCNRLSSAHNLSVIKEIWNDERKEIEQAINDYKKSMDILNVLKWGGRISLIGAIVVDALGYTEIADVIPQAVDTALLGIGTGATILSNFLPNNINPYSYLCQVHDLVPKKSRKPMTTVTLSDYVNEF